MGVGLILEESWEIYRQNFGRFVGAAAGVFVLLDLLLAIADDARGKGATFALVWGVVAATVTFVGAQWVQGALIEAVADIRGGRSSTPITELYRRIAPRLLALLTAGVLIGLFTFALGGLGAAIGPGGLVPAIVIELFLLTRFTLVAPVIVLERRSPLDAFARSWLLVTGRTWTVLGLLVLTLLLVAVAVVAFISITSFLPRFLGVWLGAFLAHSIVVPFSVLPWTLAYYRLLEEPAPVKRRAS